MKVHAVSLWMASRPPCWESGSHITCHPAKPTVSLFIRFAKCVPCIFPLFELYFLRPDITCHPAKPTVSLFIQFAKCVPCIFPLFELYVLRPDITCHQEPPRGAVGKICVRQNVTEFIHRSGKKDTRM